MHAKNYQPMHTPTSHDQTTDRPLAQSALTGQARLIELEHLAETARKVRDQAASELTRNNGDTHHVARERMAAAERMLRKAQQEIAELRSQQNTPGTASVPVDQRKDFELAVLLGHSKARFNLESSPQLTLQEQQAPRRQREEQRPDSRRNARNTSGWRSLTFAALVVAGIGIGAMATAGYLSTGTLDGAAQAVRDGTSQMVDRLRGLLAISAADHVTLAA